MTFDRLAEEDQVGFQEAAALGAVTDVEPAGLLQFGVAVRCDLDLARVHVDPVEESGVEPRELVLHPLPGEPPGTREAHDPVQPAVQFDDVPHSCQAVQPVDVLRDRPGEPQCGERPV